MQNNLIPLRISPEHLAFARYLDAQYNRRTAKRYLRLVTAPDYMSTKRLAGVKSSVNNNRGTKANA